MDDVIDKFLGSSGNNVTFDMKVKAIQDLDEVIFDTTDLTNMALFERIIEVTAKHFKSSQYKTTYEILVFLSHMNQYLSQQDNMAQYFRIYIPNLFPIALERLGDPKEKIRELTAVYILEVMQLASYFPREKFNMVIDKEFRTAIATTRFFRVKEQLIILVAESYKTIQGFAIQYYIPSVVQSLEDSNEIVRSTSKEAVIDIIKYSQERSDVIRQIKREMVKSRVRQAIIDSIFSQVTIPEEDLKVDSPVTKLKSISSNPQSNRSSPQLSVSSSSIDNIPGLGTKVSTPSNPPPPQKAMSSPIPTTNSSVSSSPVNSAVIFKFPGKRTVSQDVTPIQINSEKEYETAIRNMLPLFQEKESEENWEKRERFMKQIRGMIRGGAADFDGNCRIIKIMLDPILKTTHSLRTTLAITTIGTIIEMAENYKTQMDPIAEAVVTNLLDLTSQTKKLIASSSTQAVYIILRNISYNPKILSLFVNALSDKNANTRSSTSLFIGTMFEEMVKTDVTKSMLVRSGGLEIIEKCIKKGLQDANPSVRENCRNIYVILNDHWEDRAGALMNTLDITTRKALLRTLNSNGSSSSSAINLSSPSSPKTVRKKKVSTPSTTGPSTPSFMRGKSQPLLNSSKPSSPMTSSKLNGRTGLDSTSTGNLMGQRTPNSRSPQRAQTTPNISRISSSGYGSNTSSPRGSVSSSSPAYSSNKKSISVEKSAILQSMNKTLNIDKDDMKKSKLKMHAPINKLSVEAKEVANDQDLEVSITKPLISSPIQSASFPPDHQEQLKQQKLQELQQGPLLRDYSLSSNNSPNSASESEIIPPECQQIITKLKDMDWKNRVSGIDDLLNYISSPRYVPVKKLTKTYLSLFHDPSPYILNAIYRFEMLQAIIEKRFVSLDKLIPNIYSVIEPPDERTGQFDNLSKAAYDAIVWLKNKIRKDVLLESLFICIENKLNNQFMSETVLEGILSWLVEIIDHTSDNRDEVQQYLNHDEYYKIALEDLLKLLLKTEDGDSINNVYIIKLIQSLQELNPTSYDDVMSQYDETLQYVILKRIHNNDFELNDIEREFVEKELSNRSVLKFKKSHLFDNSSLSLDDSKSKLLMEETVPDGFTDLTISRNTSSLKAGGEIEATEDNYSEDSSIINEIVSKTWNNNSQPETLRDSTIKDHSDPQSTPKLSFKKTEMDEDIIHVSSPIELIKDETLDQMAINNKEESTMLDTYGETIEDDRLNSLNKQFKLLIEIIKESNEMDQNLLDIKVFRRLIRYSREYPYKTEESNKTISINLWNQWFKTLYHHLYQYINNENNIKSIENYENCILLYKHLILNQTSKFEGFEKQTIQVLVKCRSLYIDEVCSASEDTIESLCDELNPENSIKACIDLLEDESFITKSPLSSDYNDYRPSYMGTLYMIISKIIQALDVVYLNSNLNSLMDVITKGMNHSEVEIRKSALDSLVSLYFVFNENNNNKTENGERFLNTISKYLTLSQKRILDIYIQKFQY